MDKIYKLTDEDISSRPSTNNKSFSNSETNVSNFIPFDKIVKVNKKINREKALKLALSLSAHFFE